MSEAGRRARRDQFAGFAADIAKLVRQTALEIVGVALPQNPDIRSDRNFEAAAENDPTFLTLMGQLMATGSRTRLIAFLK